MRKVLKILLGVAEGIAVATVPGAAVVDKGVRAIIENGTDKTGAYLDTVAGAIKVIEGIEGVDIADEELFKIAVRGLEANLTLLNKSLKGNPESPAKEV